VILGAHRDNAQRSRGGLTLILLTPSISALLKALDHMQFVAMRRAEPIEKTVVDLKPDRIDHQGVATFIITDRLAEP
jgi:hypothetical protein